MRVPRMPATKAAAAAKARSSGGRRAQTRLLPSSSPTAEATDGTPRTTSRLRPAILTVVFASVTVLGTLYGASLKSKKTEREEKERVRALAIESGALDEKDLSAETAVEESPASAQEGGAAAGQVSVAERLVQLHLARRRLVSTREELERKISELEARMAQKRLQVADPRAQGDG